MVQHPTLDLSNAVEYHYDQFPSQGNGCQSAHNSDSLCISGARSL